MVTKRQHDLFSVELSHSVDGFQSINDGCFSVHVVSVTLIGVVRTVRSCCWMHDRASVGSTQSVRRFIKKVDRLYVFDRRCTVLEYVSVKSIFR